MKPSVMPPVMHSAVYEGRVIHRRHAPHAHAFQYRMAQLLLDLDELDQVFSQRWLWSVNHRNLAEWRRADYLGPADMPLADAVRLRVRQAIGRAPQGPIRLLTHLRYAGYAFNPVSFYYCFEADGITLDTVVADVTNTPWRERHSYVLPVDDADQMGRTLRWRFDKQFHVSPFMPMERRYDWRLTPPGDDLHVHMKVLSGQNREFEADLALERHALNGRSLARVLCCYPLMTLNVIGAIHWQALRLWLKRNPVYDHPRHSLPRSGENQ